MTLPIWNTISNCFSKALLPALVCITFGAKAQQPDTALIRQAKEKYKGENAVYLNVKERLEITYEDGALVARSFSTEERLLLGELSASESNYESTDKGYFNRLTDIDATAYVPDGKGSYKTRKDYSLFSRGSGDGSTFYDDSRDVFVAFPALKKYSMIRFKTAHDHREINLLSYYFPQKHFPVMTSVFEVVAPAFVNLNFAKEGSHTDWITETKTMKNGNVVYTFTCKALPAYKELPGVPSALYYMPQVLPYITSFRLPGEQKDSVLLSNPTDLYKFKYKFVGNLNIKKDTMLERIVADITKGDKTKREKAAHIYDWVQKNLHYIAFEAGLAGWIPREADTVCKRKFGDCKDMTSIQVAMCRIAGIDAYFTWIGTNYKPYTFERTPLPIVSNHMICAAKIDNEWVFMDGTHPNLPFGTNAAALQGKQAMIAISPKSYEIITIPEAAAETNTITDKTQLSISTANPRNLKGVVSQRYTGYQAWNYGVSFLYMKDDEKEKAVKKLSERGNDGYLQESYTLKPTDTGNKALELSSTFTLNDYVQQVGKQYIINMNLKRTFNDTHIDTVGRSVAWYFPYKMKRNEQVTLAIPKGFKVSYLPKPTKGMENGLWSYNISYKTDGKTITLFKEYKLETLKVAPERFVAHNKLVASLENNYKESVILTAK